MQTSPYPIQVAILTIASLFPTLVYIYLLWQWRSMTNKFWLKFIFTGVPIFLLAVLGYRAGNFLGFQNAEVLLALQYVSVFASYLLVGAFWTATQVMEHGRAILRKEREAEVTPSDEVKALMDDVAFMRDYVRKNFLTKAEV